MATDSINRPLSKPDDGLDLIDVPLCSISEAARRIHAATSTVRAWTCGRRGFAPVIEAADPVRGFLSFQNLVELQMLDALRRYHHIPLQRVRHAVKYLTDRLKVPRPLANKEMLTDGRDIIIEWAGKYIFASRGGQQGITEVLNMYLRRIDYYPNGSPRRLYPFSRRVLSNAIPDLQSKQKDEVPRTIVIDPTIQFGRPCLSGTGIPTEEIRDRYTAGDSIKILAKDYGRQETEIEEAIRYELVA